MSLPYVWLDNRQILWFCFHLLITIWFCIELLLIFLWNGTSIGASGMITMLLVLLIELPIIFIWNGIFVCIGIEIAMFVSYSGCIASCGYSSSNPGCVYL